MGVGPQRGGSTRGESRAAARWLSKGGGGLVLTAVLLSVTACSAPARPPNIVLVTLCSFRTDRLATAGGSRELMPFVDRLAREGVSFEAAVSASSWTKPSTASLLTGLTPNVHGLVDYYPLDALEKGEIRSPKVLSEALVTLPETLRDAGYRTGCRVNNLHAGEFFHLSQGCEDGATRREMRTAGMVDDLATFLTGQPREKPFFFFLFSRDAHTPYRPTLADYRQLRPGTTIDSEERLADHRRELDQELRRLIRAGGAPPADLVADWTALYEAQLPEIDRALARIPEILRQTGRLDDTLVVFTADHGERLLERGELGHGGALDEAVLHIPLIVWGRGVAGGRRVPDLVRSIDLYPTLTELAGAKPPAVLQGRSLAPYLRGPAAPAAVTAFSSFNGNAHTLRDGVLKLWMGPGDFRGLYRLDRDPLERENLFRRNRAGARGLEVELSRWLAAEKDLAAHLLPPGTRDLSPEAIAELKALGYL